MHFTCSGSYQNSSVLLRSDDYRMKCQLNFLCTLNINHNIRIYEWCRRMLVTKMGFIYQMGFISIMLCVTAFSHSISFSFTSKRFDSLPKCVLLLQHFFVCFVFVYYFFFLSNFCEIHCIYAAGEQHRDPALDPLNTISRRKTKKNEIFVWVKKCFARKLKSMDSGHWWWLMTKGRYDNKWR